MKRICTFLYFNKIYIFFIDTFCRSSKEKANPPKVTPNIPQKIETSLSIEKQQDKTSSNHNRREKEPNRDQDRREHYSSQASSNRYRDRDNDNRQHSGSRRRYSPPSSSRDRHYDRNRGKLQSFSQNIVKFTNLTFF
jgi:hypothetical protein